MKYITDFLNNTTLTAGQQIAVAIISSFIMIVLTPVLAKIYKLIQTKIAKLLKPVKDKYQRYKRLKKGKLNMNDYIALQKRLSNGQTLSKAEMKAYEKTKSEIEKSMSKISEQFKGFRLPKL